MTRRSAKRGRSGYYTQYLAHYTSRNAALLLLGGVFLSGVLMGALLRGSVQGDLREYWERLMGAFLDNRSSQNLRDIFSSCASSSLLYLGVLFVCGFCAISQPVVIATLLLRGLGFGLSVSSLYARFGLAAGGYVALFLLPDMLFSILAILVCSRESLRLSGSFLSSVTASRQDREFYSLRIYFARYLVAAALCVLSAFVQAVLHIAFAKTVVLG